jgi:hypothetical protein
MGLEELKAKKAEEAQEAAEASSPSAHEAKKAIEAQQAELDRLERTTGRSGAVPLTPKAEMLDATDVEARHPDLKLRYVNTADAAKVQSRISKGYRKLSKDEGQRERGNLSLFGVPKERHEQLVAQNRELHEARLQAHNTEVEKVAESVAKELRDRYGVKNADILLRGEK